MAARTKKTNGRGNGGGRLPVDLRLVQERAGQVTHSASGIARIAGV